MTFQNRPRGMTSDGQSTIYAAMPGMPQLNEPGSTTRRSWPARHWRTVVLSSAAAVVIGGLALEQFGGEYLQPTSWFGSGVGNIERAALLSQIDSLTAKVNIEAEANGRMQKDVACMQASLGWISEGYKTLYQRSIITTQTVANIQQQLATELMQMMRESQQANNGMAQFSDYLAMLGKLLNQPEITDKAQQAGRDLRKQATGAVTDTMRQSLETVKKSLTDWSTGLPNPMDIDRVVSAARMTDCAPPPPAPAPAPIPPYDHRKTANKG
jgi:hypothetical protein